MQQRVVTRFVSLSLCVHRGNRSALWKEQTRGGPGPDSSGRAGGLMTADELAIRGLIANLNGAAARDIEPNGM